MNTQTTQHKATIERVLNSMSKYGRRVYETYLIVEGLEREGEKVKRLNYGKGDFTYIVGLVGSSELVDWVGTSLIINLTLNPKPKYPKWKDIKIIHCKQSVIDSWKEGDFLQDMRTPKGKELQTKEDNYHKRDKEGFYQLELDYK